MGRIWRYTLAMSEEIPLGRRAVDRHRKGPDKDDSEHWEREAEALDSAGERLERELRELRKDAQLAYEDPLTKLPNRRAFFERTSRVFDAITRGQQIDGMDVKDAAMLAFDIDTFKLINDTYGHDTGDEVLKAFANLLASSFRHEDLIGRVGKRARMGGVARTGGEEFFALMVGASTDLSRRKADQVRDNFANLSISFKDQNGDDQTIRCTVSVGVAGTDTVPNDSVSSAEEWVGLVMKKADKALYAAKAAGRNRVVAFGKEVDQGVNK